MISRPIVAAPLLGLLIGEFKVGLVTGAWLELMWINKAPIGNYIPPAHSYLSVITVGAMLLAGVKSQDVHHFLIFSLFFLIPLAYLGKGLDTWLYRLNETNAKKAEEGVKEGNVRKVGREHLCALARGLLIATFFMVSASLLGALVLRSLNYYLPSFAYRVAETVFYFFPPVLLGYALQGAYAQGDLKLFVMAAFVGGLACLLIYGIRL